MRPAGIALSMQATAAYAASEPSLAHVKPMVASFVGYEFEVGPMIAGLLACLAVLFFVSQTEPNYRWSVDIPVSVIALLFTAGAIQAMRPIPLVALGYGTGLGALGVGIIRAALAFVQRNMPFGDQDDPAGPKPPSP